MYSAGQRATFETLRSLAAGSVGASYVALGSSLSNAGSALYLFSALDTDVFISFDGVNDHLYMGQPPSGETTTLVVPFGENKPGNAHFELAKGTIIYVKQGPGGSPSSGSLYAAVLYGKT